MVSKILDRPLEADLSVDEGVISFFFAFKNQLVPMLMKRVQNVSDRLLLTILNITSFRFAKHD